MPSGNSSLNPELIERIEQARRLLDEVLKLASVGKQHSSASKVTTATRPKINAGAIDFSMPMRPFVKKYGKGMNGAKKFTLLVAFLTKGDSSVKVTLAEVEKSWNKMTAKSLMGVKFNRLYPSQAKDNDWTHAEKTGSYNLRPSWKDIFV
jgi:hypothetical protein